MPRLPRIHIKGVLYYITCRGIQEQHIFKDERDYEMFVDLLKKYKEQYGIRLFSFVLLPEHLHLLLEVVQDRDTISGFMHDLNNTYTKYFNSRYDRKGHLFRGRFKSALIEKEPNLLKLTAYMHLNPKRLDLVDDSKKYMYSSYNWYLESEKTKQFNVENEIAEVLRFLEGRGYGEFVDNLSEEETESLQKGLKRGGVVGSEEFVKMINEEIANFQVKSLDKGFNGKLSKYKIFVLTGGALVILIASLTGIYFYFVTGDKMVSVGSNQMMQDAIRRVEDLDSTEWNIRLVPVSGGKQIVDTLSFFQGKFLSGNLNSSGYTASNYSLTVEENGRIVWETMQTSPEGIASWRGEIEQGVMRGVLSLRKDGSKPQDFSFLSVKYKRKE